MVEHGRKLAQGRAAEIFEHSPGKVIRVARGPADYRREAEAMEVARSGGVPVPQVHEVTAGTMVMDLVPGPTMLADLAAHPWRARRHAATLAALHDTVHQLVAPAGRLPAAPVEGDRLLHLDLHPDNVILSPQGPVLIDWANAAVGDPGADLAMSWLIMSTSRIDGKPHVRAVAVTLRRAFVALWLRRVDRSAARSSLGEVALRRAVDPNVTPEEAARVRALAARRGM